MQDIFTQRNSLLILTLLCIGQLFLHMLHPNRPLAGPLIDTQAFRQTQTATATHYQYKDGLTLTGSEISAVGVGPEQYVLLEMPVYQFVVAALYHVFGEDTIVGRLVSIFFTFIAAFLLFFLIRYLFHDDLLSLLVAVTWLFFPLVLQYSRTFLGDPMSIAFLLAGILSMLHFLDRKTIIFALLTFFFLTISFLIKPFYGPFFYLPLLWYAWQSGKFAGVVRFGIVALLPLIVVYIWLQYSTQFNIEHGQLVMTMQHKDATWWYFGTPEMRFDWQFWVVRFKEILVPIALILPLILAGIAAFFIREKDWRTKGFVLCWLIAYCIYILALLKMLNHSYYALVITPLFSFFIGYIIYVVIKWMMQQKPAMGAAVVILFCLLYPAGVAVGYMKLPEIDYNREMYEHALELKANTPEGSNLVIIDDQGDWNSLVPFYAERKILFLHYDYKQHGRYYLFERDKALYNYIAIVKPGGQVPRQLEELLYGLEKVHESEELAIYCLDDCN